MSASHVLRAATLAVALVFATAVDAKTLRWSSQGDILTMDPHAQNEGLNNAVSDHVYEPLVTRGKQLEIMAKPTESAMQSGTVTGTPTFLLNGKKLDNVISWSEMEKALKAAGA